MVALFQCHEYRWMIDRFWFIFTISYCHFYISKIIGFSISENSENDFGIIFKNYLNQTKDNIEKDDIQLMNYFSSDFKLGILGGGQLGKMLLAETRKFDIQTLVLDPSEEAPARFGCNAFYKGSLMDYDTVYQFGKMVNLLTIEIMSHRIQHPSIN